jgi:hypothetical protein
MIKYARLASRTDIQPIVEEIARLESIAWRAHYNQAHYNGDWDILPLRSIGGSMENLFSVHASASGEVAYEDTEALGLSPSLQHVLDSIHCEKRAVRLMRLRAHSEIKQHSDHELSLEDGEARLHIPIVTNDDVHFFLDEELIPMREGECWYLNLTLPHRVTNASSEDRIHLVVDCVVNEWLRNELLREDAVTKEYTPRMPDYTRNERTRIADELRRMNTSHTLELAERLENV